MSDQATHDCPRFREAREGLYGAAVTDINYNADEQWVMENGEYATHPIYYCPFCGIELAKTKEKTNV